VYRAAAGVGAGASRTLVRKCRNGPDVYSDMLGSSHRQLTLEAYLYPSGSYNVQRVRGKRWRYGG
jgi:hypothetical protein